MAEVLSVEGVCKGFSCGKRWTKVLENVSFEVGPREVVAITGRRLGGKTTLLRVAAGIERPDKGSVLLNGQSLAGMSDKERNRLLGREIVWIDQEGPALKGLEVSKWVGWSLPLHGWRSGDAERAAVRMLERVGASGCVGRCWGELSHWQRLLVGLAKAFAGDPKLVVIDDLFDALSSPATDEAADLLSSLMEERLPCGVVLSVTQKNSAIFADEIWSLKRDGGLELVSGRSRDGGDVIPFPRDAEGRGAHRTGLV